MGWPGEWSGERDFEAVSSLLLESPLWKLSYRKAGCDDKGGAECGSGILN